MVNLEDIAHSLSQLCRYGGHCNHFYSVAEHSVRLSETVDPREALLHDATEAYLGDVVSPLKSMLTEYRMLEDHIRRVIALRFGLAERVPGVVALADRTIRQWEVAQLFSYHDYRDDRAQFWSPSLAKVKFLERAQELRIR